MDKYSNPHESLSTLFAAILLLVLCACKFTNLTFSPQPALLPTQLPVLPSDRPQAPAAPPSDEVESDLSLDFSSVALDVTRETVPANPASAGGPWWEIGPQYYSLTLQGYHVSNHMFRPQIFIYPAREFALASETAAKTISELQALLQTRLTGAQMPYLPLINQIQALHAQVQFLDFKSGMGVRYLTQYNQGIQLVNNSQLIYTFQGLTNDGKYYIAAILPVTYPELPAAPTVSEEQTDLLNDFPGYLIKITTMLDQQPAGNFTPDLNKLDTLIRSMEIANLSD